MVGNVLVSVDRGVATEHTGVLSISDRPRLARRRHRLRAGDRRPGWAEERGLRKVALGVFPDNARAIAVYEKRGFVREGLRRRQYRPATAFRDEVLMAWFPTETDR